MEQPRLRSWCTEDGVASYNSAGHEWALAHFSGPLGAKVIKNN